jgi:DegV family protein with EDD domain
VVDSTCDLPPEFFRKHRIGLLPISIRLGSEVVVDERDPTATMKFYKEQLARQGLDAETIPFTAEQIRQKFLEKIVLEYGYAFVITVTSTRSPIFENATKASFAILNDHKAVRVSAGAQGHFSLRVIDSKSLFSGTAVLAAEAVRLIKAGKGPNDIRRSLDELANSTCAYMVPSDLYYIRTRAVKKGDRSVSLPTYFIGKAMDIKPVIRCFRGETETVAKIRTYERAVDRLFAFAATQVKQGLRAPVVCVSYGGDIKKVKSLPGFASLAKAARTAHADLHVALMSATAAVNAGGGGVAVAFAAEPRDFDG